MKNIAKALLAIISIAGISAATSEGIEVLSIGDGIEVLSITDNGVNYGIEVLANAPAGSMVMATLNGQVLDIGIVGPNGIANLVVPTLQGVHLELIINPMSMTAMAPMALAATGYGTIIEMD